MTHDTMTHSILISCITCYCNRLKILINPKFIHVHYVCTSCNMKSYSSKEFFLCIFFIHFIRFWIRAKYNGRYIKQFITKCFFLTPVGLSPKRGLWIWSQFPCPCVQPQPYLGHVLTDFIHTWHKQHMMVYICTSFCFAMWSKMADWWPF